MDKVKTFVKREIRLQKRARCQNETKNNCMNAHLSFPVRKPGSKTKKGASSWGIDTSLNKTSNFKIHFLG